MNAKHDGNAGDEQPDLDLDQPQAGDAQVVALFRQSLQPGPVPAMDLGRIERRAKKKHRMSQALASGAVTAAAALAAVTVVVSPWSGGGGGGEGVPAGPTPTMSRTELDTTIPDVTKASLLQTGDLSVADWSIVGVGEPMVADGAPQDLSGEEWIGGVCMDNTFGVTSPDNAWERTWKSDDQNVPHDYVVSERIAQWPGMPDQASTVLDGLRSQIEACSGEPAQEGLSRSTDRTAEQLLAVPYLAVSMTDGEGTPQAQVFAVWGDALVEIEVAVSAVGGNEAQAHTGAMSVLEAAVYRLAGRAPGQAPPLGLQSPASATDTAGPTPNSDGTGEGQ